ncbi:MAG: PhzF family phenazine biosynthesis protein [Cyclobacteriaceae bacterium]
MSDQTKLPYKLMAVFTDSKNSLRGNVSAVVECNELLSTQKMQAIAADLNQPATTFITKLEAEQHLISWFAPDAEIMLCGHGTAAATAFFAGENQGKDFRFQYAEGEIHGKIEDNQRISIFLDAIPVIRPLSIPKELSEGLGIEIESYFETSNKNIVLAKSENDVATMKPDFDVLRKMETFAYAVTAKGEKVDFVSRTFIPHVQQLEDPATGSSHAALAPFWAEILGKNEMESRQLSKRGGKFLISLHNNIVQLNCESEILAEGFVYA